MKEREIAKKLLEYAQKLPVVTVTGPRQSGKTTLCKMAFPQKKYVNLEALDEAYFARTDPRGFLANFPNGAIIDEVQNVPELLSYIQIDVDERPQNGKFILTGSQNFSLMSTISQSLAGRTALLNLLPFSLNEAYGNAVPADANEVIFRGFYPRCFNTDLSPTELMQFYVSTYIERDIRSLSKVQDLLRFGNFLKLCAGRTSQILNYSSLAADAGISVNTAKDWISLLQTSFIIKLLPPFSKNISKRLVKSPKIYFLDCGLACALLGIRSAEILVTHPLRGALFETMVVGEIWKNLANTCGNDGIYFYRDQAGTEIDILRERADGLELLEIKSGSTFVPEWTKPILALEKTLAAAGTPILKTIVYNGETSRKIQGVELKPFEKLI